jgi:hypothetical protein
MSTGIDRLESSAWLITLAFGAAIGVRALTVLGAEALRPAASTFGGELAGASAAPTVRTRPDDEATRREQLLELANPDRTAEVSSEANADEPRMIRPQLYVNAGPERSYVYVNGNRVGQTPFVGEVTCREGDPVRVDVDPPKGVPMRFVGQCVGRMLTVKKEE